MEIPNRVVPVMELTRGVQDEVSSRMFELPTLLHPLSASSSHTATITRDDIDSLHHHDIGSLSGSRWTRRCDDLAVKLRGGERCEMGCVGDWDRDALG